MIRVLGRATSTNVQAVMWALAELGLPNERFDIGGAFGGTDTSEFRQKNPMGLVPVLQDGGLVMFESAAIVRYLAAQYGDSTFWPSSPAVRAPLDVWAEWAKTSMYPVIIQELFFPLVRLDPALLTPESEAAAATKMLPLATSLAARIGSGPWIGGEAFSYADIICGHLLYRYFELPFERADLPALSNYYDRLQSRPAFRKHVMVSYESLRFKKAC